MEQKKTNPPIMGGKQGDTPRLLGGGKRKKRWRRVGFTLPRLSTLEGRDTGGKRKKRRRHVGCTPPPFEMERNGGSTRCPRSKRNEKKQGQRMLPPFEKKRKDTGAALAAPVRNEIKRNGGSKCCPRSK